MSNVSYFILSVYYPATFHFFPSVVLLFSSEQLIALLPPLFFSTWGGKEQGFFHYMGGMEGVEERDFKKEIPSIPS